MVYRIALLFFILLYKRKPLTDNNTTLASEPNIALTVDVIGNDGIDGFDDVDYLRDGNMAVRFVKNAIITHICIAKGVRRL
jgi:hypothetical protein